MRLFIDETSWWGVSITIFYFTIWLYFVVRVSVPSIVSSFSSSNWCILRQLTDSICSIDEIVQVTLPIIIVAFSYYFQGLISSGLCRGILHFLFGHDVGSYVYI